jgi:hypothetical protein
MTTKARRTFMQKGLRFIYGLFLVAAAALGPAKIGASDAMDSNYRADAPCQPSSLLTEFFDGVTPPALPSGWSSTTWVTSNSGVPAVIKAEPDLMGHRCCKLHLSVCYHQRVYPVGIIKYVMVKHGQHAT